MKLTTRLIGALVGLAALALLAIGLVALFGGGGRGVAPPEVTPAVTILPQGKLPALIDEETHLARPFPDLLVFAVSEGNPFAAQATSENPQSNKPSSAPVLRLYTVPLANTVQNAPSQLASNQEMRGLSIYPSPDRDRVVIVNKGSPTQVYYRTSGEAKRLFAGNRVPMRPVFYGWHPDSRKVVIRVEGEPSELWLVDTDTSQHSVIISASLSYFQGASISPDGQRIAYALESGANGNGLWIADLSGSGSNSRIADGLTFSLAWSPDGRQIAFFSSEGLAVIHPDGSGHRTLSRNVVADYLFGPVWSPDSQFIAVVANESNQGQSLTGQWDVDIFNNATIHLIEVATGEVRPLLQDHVTGNISPAWAPGGSQVAFVSNRTGAAEVWMVGADGNGLRQITTLNKYVRAPFWSANK